MATRYTPLEHPKRIILVDEFGLKRVQTLTVTPEFDTQIAKEIGSDVIIETYGLPTATTVEITKNDYGESDTFAMFMGEFAEDPYWHLSGSTLPYERDTTRINDYYNTTRSLERQMVDFVIYHKLDGDLKYTRWVPSCRLTRATFEYTVDGVATETWTFRGSSVRNYANVAKDAGVAIGYYESTDSFRVVGDFTSGYEFIEVTVNGVVKYSNKVAGTITASSYDAGTNTTIISVTGAEFKPTDRIRLVFYRTTPRSWNDLIVDYDMNHQGRAMVFRGQVFPYMAPVSPSGTYTTITDVVDTTDTDNKKFLWVQRASIELALDSTDRHELGLMVPVSVRISYPPTITVTVDVLASSLEDLARLSDLEDWWNDTANPYRFMYEFVKTYNVLVVDIFKNRDDRPLSERVHLKRIIVSGLSITGFTDVQNIDADGTITWTMQGTWMAVSGTGIDPIAQTEDVPDPLYDV